MKNNVSSPPANRKYRQNGFTLVELIVVLIIIGILLALVIPSLTSWIDRASTKSAMAECRLAVNAAQTLSIERYTAATAAEVTADEVVAFAKLPGTVSSMQFENATLKHLTYTNKYTITYCRDFASCADHDEMFNLIKYQSWSRGATYNTGDIVVRNGIIFKRTVNNPGNNFDPDQDKGTKYGNKMTWSVIGFENESKSGYSSQYLYAEGAIVTYNGKKYQRTNYNLTGGQVPYENSSAYWTLID